VSSEKFTDVNDAASDLEDSFREASIREIQAAMVESHPDFDGKHCLECGGDMPEQRLAWGRIRCVDCQSLLERNSQLFRKYL
jgi:RNA polymerase-binding transcription factor DksA